MKDRIEELADKVYSWCVDNDGPSYGTIQSAITDAVNEALELAAQKCEGISGTSPSGHGGRYDALDCAESIRKLKV